MWNILFRKWFFMYIIFYLDEGLFGRAPAAPAPAPVHLSAAHGPIGGYCSPELFFSLLLSSLTDTAGAREARFSGSAAPAPLAPIGP